MTAGDDTEAGGVAAAKLVLVVVAVVGGEGAGFRAGGVSGDAETGAGGGCGCD